MVWTTPRKSFKITAIRSKYGAGNRRVGRMRRSFLRKLGGSINRVFSYKRNVIRASITQTVAPNDLHGALSFKLSDAPNYTEFTALYDSYKIGKIVVRFIPQQNMQAMTNPTNLIVPKLFTVIDTDDATVHTSINELREYETCKVTRGFKVHKRVFKPMVAMALYGNNFFTSYGNKSNAWINTASPNVEHYGLKYSMDAGVASQTVLQRYDIECTYYLQFRSVK